MSVMPVFRGRKGMLFLHMENEKKRKKLEKNRVDKIAGGVN